MTDTTFLTTRLTAGAGEELPPAEYMRLAREVRADDGRLEPLRVAILSSFTFSFVEPFFVVEASRRGFRSEIHFGAFGQFEQEVLEGSKLEEFAPDALVIAMRPEDVDPDVFARYHASGGRRYAELAAELEDRLERLVRTVRAWSEAPILVANFAPPSHPPFGLFEANLEGASSYQVAETNASLRRRLSAHAGVVVWDYAGLVRARGAQGWTDRRLWSLARIPVAARHQPALARHLVRTLLALRGKPSKCLVLDLDNTLWGGVIGDDGIEGIQLGDDFPGNVYKSFQRSVLTLMDRGILLAIASKNEPDVVQRVFGEHPEMLIQWDHFAAARVGWEPKSRSVREIATELNIGADSLVLFDDNPVERAEVRANAPEVAVIEVPQDPLRYEETLWGCGYFDQVALSEEDLRRTEMYRSERQRRTFATRFESVEDFLHSLEMTAEIGEADPVTMGRVAQLVNRTNQFNLTTRRRSQAQLEALCQDPDHAVVWLRVRDRFGDQGIVAVGILRLERDAGVIDTFLMSCRMMNRHVEDALLADLARRTRAAGRTKLVGEHLPTPKNRMVADLYQRFGFEDAGELEHAGRRFGLDLNVCDLEWPSVIRRFAAAPDGGVS